MSFHSDSIFIVLHASQRFLAQNQSRKRAEHVSRYGRGSGYSGLKNPDAVKLLLPLCPGVIDLHASPSGLEIAAVALVGRRRLGTGSQLLFETRSNPPTNGCVPARLPPRTDCDSTATARRSRTGGKAERTKTASRRGDELRLSPWSRGARARGPRNESRDGRAKKSERTKNILTVRGRRPPVSAESLP